MSVRSACDVPTANDSSGWWRHADLVDDCSDPGCRPRGLRRILDGAPGRRSSAERYLSVRGMDLDGQAIDRRLPLQSGLDLNGWFGGFLPAISFSIVAATGNIYSGLWYPIIIASITFVVGMLFVKETKDSAVYDG